MQVFRVTALGFLIFIGQAARAYAIDWQAGPVANLSAATSDNFLLDHSNEDRLSVSTIAAQAGARLAWTPTLRWTLGAEALGGETRLFTRPALGNLREGTADAFLLFRPSFATQLRFDAGYSRTLATENALRYLAGHSLTFGGRAEQHRSLGAWGVSSTFEDSTYENQPQNGRSRDDRYFTAGPYVRVQRAGDWTIEANYVHTQSTLLHYGARGAEGRLRYEIEITRWLAWGLDTGARYKTFIEDASHTERRWRGGTWLGAFFGEATDVILAYNHTTNQSTESVNTFVENRVECRMSFHPSWSW